MPPRFAGLPGHRLEQIVFVRYIFRSELFGHFFGAAPRLNRPLPLFPNFYTRARVHAQGSCFVSSRVSRIIAAFPPPPPPPP